MKYTMDEIYEMLSWDSEMQGIGIAEAKKLKCLYPLLQPIVPGLQKKVWENCAIVLASKTDQELKPYLFALLEWLQDLNWPGAERILNRLSVMKERVLQGPLAYSRRLAEMNQDETWLMWLGELEAKRAKFNPCLKNPDGIPLGYMIDVFRSCGDVDETTFYFSGEEPGDQHYLGFLPEYALPYWAGYCDMKDGLDCGSAEELFFAKVYDGHSLADRWEEVHLYAIGWRSVQAYTDLHIKDFPLEAYEQPCA